MKRFLFAVLMSCSAATALAGTRDLKEDTAVTIVVGPFVDDTGAAVTAPTIASIDITAYKNDGTAVTITPAASGSSNDMAHVDDGYFSLELTTTDTSTAGYLRLTFQISGALIFHEDFHVLPANIYDSRYSTDKLQVDVVQAEGSDYTDYVDGRTLASANYFDPAADTVANVTLCATTTSVTNGVSLATSQGAITFNDLNVTNEVDFADGMDIDRSTSNASGVTIDGNGTGHGVFVQSGTGATGDAMRLLAASTNGSGARIIGAGTGQGIYTQGGATGNGLYALGGASEGAGAALESQASTQKNAPGLSVLSASNNGMTITAGTTTGRAALILTGAQSGYGDAIRLFTGGTGVDIRTTAAPFGSVGSVGNDATHVHLSGLAGADDVWNGYLLRIFDTSAGTYTTTAITDWDNAGDLATVASLGFTPDNTDKYWILEDDTSSILSAILGDTAELQTDWTDDGRLDLLIDAIKAVTDKFEATTSEITGVPAANADYFDMIRLGYQRMIYGGKQTADKKQVYDSGGTPEYEHDVADTGTEYTESSANAP